MVKHMCGGYSNLELRYGKASESVIPTQSHDSDIGTAVPRSARAGIAAAIQTCIALLRGGPVYVHLVLAGGINKRPSD